MTETIHAFNNIILSLVLSAAGGLAIGYYLLFAICNLLFVSPVDPG